MTESIIDRESIIGNASIQESGHYDYHYDALNRLTEITKDGNTQREYIYDAFGIRTKR